MPSRAGAKGRASSARQIAPAADVALQVMVPEHLKREISVRAASEGTTNRTIILAALRAVGFTVADEELCDRRKARS